MLKKKIDQSRLYERYRKEKIAFSVVFLGAYLKFLTACFAILVPIMITNYGLLSHKMLISVLMLSGTLTVKKYLNNTLFGYTLGLTLLWCLDLKNLECAFWKFPTYSGLLIAVTVHIFCHIHLELIYNTVHGYITVILHLTIWLLGSIYSGILKTPIPPDIIFTMVAYICTNFFWYKYKLMKDYEDIERKIQLEDNQSNIENLINAVPEGIVVINESCEIIMKNNTYEKLLQGVKLEGLKLIEKYCNDQKGFDENLYRKICKFIQMEGRSTKFGVIMVKEEYLECTGSKVLWDNEPAIVLTFREITDIVGLENQIMQTSKTLKILHGVSHELKTPMNMIINFNLELMTNSQKMSIDMRKTVKRNISILRYILSLIRDMIDYSYLKSNNLGLSFSWVDLTSLIEESIHVLQDVYQNSSFELHLPLEHFSVYTDKNRLRQVLLSLISTSLGLSTFPQVNLTATNNSNRMSLIITFDSYKNFFMNSTDTIEFIKKSLKFKISKQLMHKICCDELIINKGDKDFINITIFFNLIEYHEFKDPSIFDIPDEGDILLPLTTSSIGIKDLGKYMDILIVDDIEINIEILKKMIESLECYCGCYRNHRKYTIHCANSGKAALEMIRYQQKIKSGYKIIIMDCLMPVMDGWETSVAINELYSLGVIKFLPYIIAYSAFDSKEDLEKCIISGMCCHISKPCIREELCQAINDWITRV